MSEVRLSRLIAPIYYQAYYAIKNHEYTHYWFKGGRGSAKSSFISIMIILGVMMHKDRHAVCFRRVADTLRDSVFAQLLWAIDVLDVNHLWEIRISPLQLIYTGNGNKIIFRGMDDPQKAKSIKTARGYFGYIWFEELAEFQSMDVINTTLQSVMRGGDEFSVFYSYNPPESINSWVNVEAVVHRDDRIVYHSTYLDVPSEWLGDAFIVEAEHMLAYRPQKYEWQYLGKPTGTGGEVFTNVEAMTMSDDMISQFDRVRAGLDWGWSIDPLAYIEFQFDARKKSVYIFHEKYGLKISNEAIAEHIHKRFDGTVHCDSAEGKSISELRRFGVRAVPCVKGRGSVAYGMRYLTDELEHIYIDPKRCPNAYREFTGYELERDKYGNFKTEYPDKDNHTIDALRYGVVEMKIKTARSNLY